MSSPAVYSKGLLQRFIGARLYVTETRGARRSHQPLLTNIYLQANVIVELRDKGKTEANTAYRGWDGLDASNLHEHGHGHRERRKVESPDQHTLRHNRTFCQHARTAGTEVHNRSLNESSLFTIPASCWNTLHRACERKPRFPPSLHLP